MQTNRKNNVRQTLVKLLVDTSIFLAFLVATNPNTTGLPVHEWLGVAFAAAIVTHLLLGWSWIVEVTRRLFGKVTWPVRITYILNALLFVDMTVVIFTGLMISRNVVPALGIQLTGTFGWRELHGTTANLSLLLLGLHVALHWNWIVSMLGRYVIQPIAALRPQPAAKKEEVRA